MEKKTNAVNMSEGIITEEALAELKSRIGNKFPMNPLRNRLACRETMLKFTGGIGDINPLYNDEEYAKTTRYGRLVAHPAWFYTAVNLPMQGLRGVHGFHAGDEWEWYKPVLAGDEVDGENVLVDVQEKKSEFAGRAIYEFHDRKVWNQRGEAIAKVRGWIIRAERRAAREKGKYSNIKMPHPWTEQELKKVEDEVMAEEVRGNNVRYWEDVNAGDALTPVVIGPIGLTDVIAWGGSRSKAHRAKMEIFRKHPAWAFRDPDTYSLEPIAAVHYLIRPALKAGLPYAYETGIKMNSWTIKLLTNWMGDEGWLKKCHCEYRRFVYLSDVVWVKGKVTKKYVDDKGEYCVDVETSGFNQRGENTMPGWSVVILPSRVAGTLPVAKRLPG